MSQHRVERVSVAMAPSSTVHFLRWRVTNRCRGTTAVAWAGALLLVACSAPKVVDRNGGGGSGASNADGGFQLPPAGGGSGTINVPTMVAPCNSDKCSDFPAAPILDQGAPPNAASMFSNPASGTGPCLVEPEDGTLFPQQWLRPRVRWSGTTGLHRITIHSDSEDHDLVAYTSNPSWTLPKDIWTALGTHVTDKDITVTVRAASGGETTSKFRIAPVPATGSMVFWAVKPSEVGRDLTGTDDYYDSGLRGFSVGEETTVDVLRPMDVQQPSADETGTKRHVHCIGCHAATPDDGFVGLIDDWPWNLAIAGVKPTNRGQPLPNLTDGGLAALNLPWGGMMSFSAGQWSPGHRLVVLASSLQDYTQLSSEDTAAPGRLTWYNLDAPGGMITAGVQVGEIMRQGDQGGAACPTWSHDGTRIVYSSTMGGNQDGALESGTTDLFSVPFNDGKGGAAMPLAGAADTAFEEYYPALSPDDSLVVYTRVPPASACTPTRWPSWRSSPRRAARPCAWPPTIRRPAAARRARASTTTGPNGPRWSR